MKQNYWKEILSLDKNSNQDISYQISVNWAPNTFFLKRPRRKTANTVEMRAFDYIRIEYTFFSKRGGACSYIFIVIKNVHCCQSSECLTLKSAFGNKSF